MNSLSLLSVIMNHSPQCTLLERAIHHDHEHARLLTILSLVANTSGQPSVVSIGLRSAHGPCAPPQEMEASL